MDQSAQRIILMAYRDSQLLGETDIPTTDQYASGLARLNDLLALWATQGLKPWMVQVVDLPLVSGTGTYLVGPTGVLVLPRAPRLIDAQYRSVTGSTTPLGILSQTDYNSLTNRTQTGAINSVFPQKLSNGTRLFFWMVPGDYEATGVVELTLRTPLASLEDVTETIQFPPEWFMALRWGLADDMCTGQPGAIIERCSARANQFRMALEDWDTEDASVRFALSNQ